jgi:hypothetical protein
MRASTLPAATVISVGPLWVEPGHHAHILWCPDFRRAEQDGKGYASNQIILDIATDPLWPPSTGRR